MLGKNKKQKEINIFDNIPTMADILLPETLQEKKDYLILGYNKFTRIFAMTIYPEQTWVSWLDDLFHIGNINIAVKIEPSSNGNVINQLTKKLVQAQSEYAPIWHELGHLAQREDEAKIYYNDSVTNIKNADNPRLNAIP